MRGTLTAGLGVLALGGCSFGLTYSKDYDSPGSQDSRVEGGEDTGFGEESGGDSGGIDAGAWASGDLLITEVLYTPLVVGDAVGEWIELYNASTRTVDAAGLTVESDAGDSFTVSSTGTLPIPAGASFVLAASGDSSINGGVSPDYVYPSFPLDNTAAELTVSAADTILDTVYWDDGATMPRAPGASLMVDPDSYGASNPRFWCAATVAWTSGGDKGSPGELNEPCVTIDHDGDGYTALDGDCDDTNPEVFPGASSPDSTVDWDCDGVRDGTPTAAATATGNAYACDPIQLDGSGSYDPDGDSLSFSWSLVSAPAGSAATTASIDTTTSVRPTLYADVTGEYIFSLTVSDRVTASAPVSLSVTATTRPDNQPPSPNAGPNQSQSGSADCTPVAYSPGVYECDDCVATTYSLDASSSTDPDGDVMSYTWAVTVGGPFASLSTNRGSTTVVTVSGVTANYGSAATQDVIVTLTATDCMGASASDDVLLRMSCTGY